MATVLSPYITPEGAHVFPVRNLRQDCGSEQEGTGEICWSARDGLTFRFEFLGTSSATAFPSPQRGETGAAGSSRSIASLPQWTGQLADGSEASLIGVIEKHTTQTSFGTSGGSRKRLIHGQAAYASISLHMDSELAFWFDTEPADRLFCLGLDVFPWPIDEMIAWSVGDTQKQRSRGSLALASSPPLTLYCGSQPHGHPAWLTYEAGGEAATLWYDKICEDVRAFLSFVIGRWTPFVWNDKFISADRLSRVYFGWHRQKIEPNGSEQPVPLGRTTEVFRHGKDVISQLPSLFARFRELRVSYDVEWIATPIWYALDVFLEDRLSLACVSLERLATAHESAAVRSRKKPLMTPEQSKALSDAIKPILWSIGTEKNIPADVLAILERKIENLHQTPNADKLRNVFADVGIDLTDAESDVLGNRNRCLHGSTTLRDAQDPEAVDDEVRRFDTVRTLINRAVLSLLGYAGPYVDYSERPAKGNFPIKSMGLQKTSDAR